MSISLTSIRAWLLAVRPITLTASLIPVVLGDLLARSVQYSGEHNFKLSVWALLSACFIQIGTNLYNDVVDFKTGADDQNRVGPKRLILSGSANAKQVHLAANASFAIAILFGVPLVIHSGLPILLIGIFSILFGFGYSAPPLRLAYRGWSEAFVILFFGLIAVAGVSFVHLGKVTSESIFLGLIVGLLSTNLLIINNLRDIESDKRVGKLTLAARFGARFARLEFYFCTLIALALTVLWGLKNYPAGVLPLLAFLPLYKVYKLINVDQHSRLALPLSALAHLSFGIICAIVLVTR